MSIERQINPSFIELKFDNWPLVQSYPSLNVVLEAASEAGKLLYDGFYNKFNTYVKADKSEFTPYDIQAEQIARKYLNKYEKNLVIMGEELSPNENINKGKFWVIDGIDGTTNFSRQIPVTNFTMAEVIDKKTSVGVVYDFLHGNLYYGVNGEGAYKNGRKIKVNNRNFNESVISFAPLLNVRKDKGLLEKEQVEAVWESMKDISLESKRFHREFQSGALELAMVASGQLDGYASSWTSPWDLSAGVLLVKEAGGTVTNILGSTWEPSYWGVIAGSETVHPELFKIVNNNFLRNLPNIIEA